MGYAQAKVSAHVALREPLFSSSCEVFLLYHAEKQQYLFPYCSYYCVYL